MEQTIVTTTLVTLLSSFIDNDDDDSQVIINTNDTLISNDIKTDNVTFLYSNIHLLFRHENVKNISQMTDTISYTMTSIVELQSKSESKKEPEVNDNPIDTKKKYFDIIKSSISNLQFRGGSYISQVETLKKSIMIKINILNNR